MECRNKLAKSVWIWLTCALLPSLALADTVLPSPDGAYKATFIEVPGRASGVSECLLNVADQSGHIVLSQDYRSESGLQGFSLAKAQWTPDSKFLVYTLTSSGGHQPWRFPLNVYTRKRNKVVNLETRLGPATNPAFVIRAPNTLTVQHKDKKTFADRVSTLNLGREIK